VPGRRGEPTVAPGQPARRKPPGDQPHLSRRGLITLAVDPQDARGRIVEYSFDAQDLRRAAHRVVDGLERLLETRIGAEAAASLRAGLARDWRAPVVIDAAGTKGR